MFFPPALVLHHPQLSREAAKRSLALLDAQRTLELKTPSNDQAEERRKALRYHLDRLYLLSLTHS